MSRLFQPLHLGPLESSNRILIAPMCQYSADADGNATDWHMIHLGQMAVSGAGLLIIEATAVSAEARITPSDLGLYSDANEAALGRVMKALRPLLANAHRYPDRSCRAQGVELRAMGQRCADQGRSTAVMA